MTEKYSAKGLLQYIYFIKSSSLPRVEAQIDLLEKMLKYLKTKRENYLKKIKKLRDDIKKL